MANFDKFYAVAHGGKRGIYREWGVCEKWIYGFPGAKYQSFDTAKDAQTYLSENAPQQFTTAQEQWRMSTRDASGSAKMETAVVPKTGLLLTDVLCLVAFSGFEDHIALGGCALNRHTWNDPVLWRAIINVKFASKESQTVWDATLTAKKIFGLKTRLMIYIAKKSLPWVERALSFGATVNCSVVAPSPTDLLSPRFLTSPIVLAVESASTFRDRELALSFVTLLLALGAEANQGKAHEPTQPYQHQASPRRDTITPLEIAASLGFVDMMRLLVTGSKGSLCIPGVNSDDFCRPLQIAIELHHLNCARFLLNQGVEVNYSFVEAGAGAGAGAEPAGDVVFRSYLIEIFSPSERHSGSSAQVEQAERNAFARIMLQRGALVSYTETPVDAGVTTPLHETMSTGNLEAFKMLLEEFNCDPNPNMIDGYRPSVLLEAARDLKIDYADVLVSANANVNAAIHFALGNAWDLDDQWMDKQDWTPLHFFSASNFQTGMELVINAGAEIDAQTFMGYTPLLLCAKGHRGHFYGAGLGQQAALKAREAADVACCELLLVSGSNATHERNWGIMGFLDGDEEDEGDARAELNYTAATYAVLRNAPALLSLLCLHGADVLQVPNDGYTLIMRSVEKVNVECLSVLLKAQAPPCTAAATLARPPIQR